jgi:hypothetical protein
MKTDSKSNAYPEVLAWAIEHFRQLKARGYLEKGIGDWVYDSLAQVEIRFQDAWKKNNPGPSPSLMGAGCLVDETARAIGLPGIGESEVEMGNVLRRMSAVMIERGVKLPQPLAEFVAASLREPKPPGRPGRRASDLYIRDLWIAETIEHIVETWGFSRTRRRNGKTKTDCAASIVSEALAANNIGLSEDDIIKVSDRIRPLLRGIKSVMSEETSALLKKHSANPYDVPSVDTMAEIGGAFASDYAKFAGNPADYPQDVVDLIVERIERRRPEHLKLLAKHHPWITDRRK